MFLSVKSKTKIMEWEKSLIDPLDQRNKEGGQTFLSTYLTYQWRKTAKTNIAFAFLCNHLVIFVFTVWQTGAF